MAKIIEKFDKSGNVVIWLKKVKLVGRIQKMGDLSLVTQLFLEGSAFALYEQLSDDKKTSAKYIQHALFDAFAVDNFKAYKQFKDGKKTNLWMCTWPVCVNFAVSKN